MTRPTPPNEQHAVEDAVQVSGWERQLAVAYWLLSAARDRDVARREWLTHGAALLACGGIFSAVRMPGDLVRAAAQTADEAEVNGFLRRALDGGPVIHSRYADHYYVLVPGSTAWRRPPGPFPAWSAWAGTAFWVCRRWTARSRRGVRTGRFPWTLPESCVIRGWCGRWSGSPSNATGQPRPQSPLMNGHEPLGAGSGVPGERTARVHGCRVAPVR
ncbi:hypothetical protein GCM10009564_26410 [Streptomyces thermogriseus]|uniref:Uncharacterized protein n=1 Tax=Streptomyces thermogriseus TaxID=75292 RepID=A0ABN1SZQ6_9ACTN